MTPTPEDAHIARERQLADILDSTMDAIITIDASLRIRLFNRAASQMFGYSTAEMLGSRIDRLIPPDSRMRHQAHVAAFAASGVVARGMGEPRPLTGLRADGAEFPIEASISRTGSGEDMLLTVVVRDASRLRSAEQAREAHAAAGAAHRARAEFLSLMGHELRTPLNAVLGLTRLLQATTTERLTPTESERLALVLTAAERLHGLIEDMLALGNGTPRAPPPAPAEAMPPLPADDTSGLVLYVEDDAVNVLLVEELLRRMPGVRLAVARDGQSGLDAARTQRPDLVLLDLNLPDMNGLEVLRQLRADDSMRHVRVAVLSAGGTPDEVQTILDAGAVAYWTKPIDFGPFMAGIRQFLQAPRAPGPKGS